jgi:hypothetical protein
MVHEKLAIPWITVSLLPMHFPHGDLPARPVTEQRQRMLTGWVRFLNQIRLNLGFGEWTYEEFTEYSHSNRLILLASSPHFSEPLLHYWPHARMTGFWFDHDLGDWSRCRERADLRKGCRTRGSSPARRP